MKNLVNAALHDRASLKGLRPWRRHSLVLLVLGCVYFLTGLLYACADSNPVRNLSLVVPLNVMGWTGWGLVWMLAGVLAIISSRWPIPSEKWGYTVLSFLAALWASFYGCGIFYGAATSGLGQLLIWGGVAFVLWAISGLDNPVHHTHKPGR